MRFKKIQVQLMEKYPQTMKLCCIRKNNLIPLQVRLITKNCWNKYRLTSLQRGQMSWYLPPYLWVSSLKTRERLVKRCVLSILRINSRSTLMRRMHFCLWSRRMIINLRKSETKTRIIETTTWSHLCIKVNSKHVHFLGLKWIQCSLMPTLNWFLKKRSLS